MNKLPVFTGTTIIIEVDLVESRWLQDSQSSLIANYAPTQCTFIQVLSSLSGLLILGDWTVWYETIALDNVIISNTKNMIPLCAMSKPDASICTCG
jgi:hypothetical protein